MFDVKIKVVRMVMNDEHYMFKTTVFQMNNATHALLHYLVSLIILCTTEIDSRHIECKLQFRKIISAMFESSRGAAPRTSENLFQHPSVKYRRGFGVALCALPLCALPLCCAKPAASTELEHRRRRSQQITGGPSEAHCRDGEVGGVVRGGLSRDERGAG